MTQAVTQHRLNEPKELLRHQVIVLREYAKWCLLRGYVFPPSRETHRRELMREFFRMGTEVKLTERDIVMLLYRGLFCKSSAPSH